jgi:uncharacterized protein
VLLALPLGLAIGLAMGALGGGGAVLAVPVLVYALGQDVHTATTASLAVVAVAAVAGGLGRMNRREVCWPQLAAFVPGALAGTVAGTVANRAVGGDALLIGFAAVMAVAAGFTWRRASSPEGARAGGCPPLRVRRTAAAGLAVGALTGFFGVGGGFLVVPMLALAIRFPLRQAIGTSLVIVALVSLAGLGAHLAGGSTIDWALTGALAAACGVGALAGSVVAARVDQRSLGRAFAALLVVVAAYVLGAVALGG